jgi:hypothetical protein
MTPEVVSNAEGVARRLRQRGADLLKGGSWLGDVANTDAGYVDALLLENATLKREHGELRSALCTVAMERIAFGGDLSVADLLARIPDRSGEVPK